VNPHLIRHASRREEATYRDALAAAHARIEALERERQLGTCLGFSIDQNGLLSLVVRFLMVAAAGAVAFGAWCLFD